MAASPIPCFFFTLFHTLCTLEGTPIIKFMKQFYSKMFRIFILFRIALRRCLKILIEGNVA